MKQYIARMNAMKSNFSLKEFKGLLKEIDEQVMNGNIHEFDSEFLSVFSEIMNFVNDKNMVDGKHITLGNLLLDNTLKNHEKLSPTLTAFFYLDQKKKLGLDEEVNNISFSGLGGGYMGINHYQDPNRSDELEINLKRMDEFGETDKYNYETMRYLLHEITHVYQATRTEDTSNLFDKATFYDYQMMNKVWLQHSGVKSTGNDIVFHESMVSETMADEQALVYMLQIAKEHPEYFNDDLIEQKRIEYDQRKKLETQTSNRENHSKYVEYYKGLAMRIYGSLEPIQPLLMGIEHVEKKLQPVLDELRAQGISEDVTRDCNYNIFTGSYYHYDGQDITMSIEPPNKQRATREDSATNFYLDGFDEPTRKQQETKENKVSEFYLDGFEELTREQKQDDEFYLDGFDEPTKEQQKEKRIKPEDFVSDKVVETLKDSPTIEQKNNQSNNRGRLSMKQVVQASLKSFSFRREDINRVVEAFLNRFKRKDINRADNVNNNGLEEVTNDGDGR